MRGHGAALLGQPVTQGEVLYLDLESGRYRVRERLAVLGHDPAPQALLVCHDAPRMEAGLLGALNALMDQRPQVRLIILDTLGRVKSPGKGGENAYEADYRILGDAQRWALRRQVALLMVHHLRKSVAGQGNDVYERVSGSTGITGVCDAVMVLTGNRREKDATLHLDGRDIESRQLALRFEDGLWTLLSDDAQAYEAQRAYRESPLPGAVKGLMAGRQAWEGTATDMLEAFERMGLHLQLPPRELAIALRALAPRLEAAEGLRMIAVKTNGRRLIRVSRTAAPDTATALPQG